MSLNYQTYQKLKNEVSPKIEEDKNIQWYSHSYKVFVSQPMDTLDDFWKMVSFAYSWMPTIPNIYMEKLEDSERLIIELNKLKQGNGNIKWLIETLTPVINNSVVGVSKVLHFAAPLEIPIYDSRVIKAWSKLFKENKQLRLQYRPNGDIGKVLFYIEKMKEWVAECKKEKENLTLRDIELVLYYYGRN